MTKPEALDILANEKLVFLNLRRKFIASSNLVAPAKPSVLESLYETDRVIAALDIAIEELQKGDKDEK